MTRTRTASGPLALARTIVLSASIAMTGALTPAAVLAQQQSSAPDPAASNGAAAPPAPAAPAAPDTDNADLAKKLSNPISDLVSLPFQFNWENGIGPLDETRYILNIQPVMPFSLNTNTNLIVRVIAPIISQPPAVTGGVPVSGVSDILASFFLSPVTKGSITWGIGPAISVPSTSLPTLGTEKWSGGPTGVVLRQQDAFTYGVLINQIWSFAGNPDRPNVNQMFIQPFFAYTTKDAWTFTLQSETTANWQVDGTNRWNAPINGLVSKVSSFGSFPASYQLGGGYFVARPDNGATWKIRAAIVILMPRKK
jgi:hypothetical protein